jgi:hypothetical protein
MYGLVTLLSLLSIVLQLILLTPRDHFASFPSESQEREDGSGSTAERSGASLPGKSMRTRDTLLWFLYVVTTAAALYSEYYSVFVLAAEIAVVWLWGRSQKRSRTAVTIGAGGGFSLPPAKDEVPSGPRNQLFRSGVSPRAWIFAWSAILILYLPWLVYAGPKLYSYVTTKVGIEQYSRLDPFTFFAQHLAAFSVGHLLEFPWLDWGALYVVALAIVGSYHALPYLDRIIALPSREAAFDADRGYASTTRVILIYFSVPLLCGWLVNIIYPFHPIRYERLLLFDAPLFCLLIANGLDVLLNFRLRLGYATFCLILLISAVSLYDFYATPRYADEDYRPLIREMDLKAGRGDVVLAPYPWQIGYLESYYQGPPLQIVQVPSDEWISQPGRMDGALNSIRASSPRVWLLAYQTKGRILEDQIANYFADDYLFTDEWSGNTRLEYFAQGSDPSLNENPIALAPDLKLDSYGVGVEPITAGTGFIRVRLHWESNSNAYSFSMRLVDRSGRKLVQQDEAVNAGNEIDRRGLYVPPEVPAGTFDFRLVVYLRANGSPIALPDGSREISLGRIIVNPP